MRRNVRTYLQWAGLAAGPMLAAACYLALPEHYIDEDGKAVTLTHAGRATLGLMVWMATWWLTEAIDISATALLPLAVLPVAGATTMKAAAEPYATDYIFLFMGGFILALSMQRWGLDKRIALITLRVVGTSPRMMVAGFMIATAMLSGFVSNTATAAMMMPVGLSVIELVRQPRVNHEARDIANFATCIMLGIAYAASIGGVATIIGSPPNVFLVGFIRETIDATHRQEISFLEWMLIGAPLVGAFLPLTWLLLTRVMYPIRIDQIEQGEELLAETYRRLGSMKPGEWVTFIVFTVTAGLWISRPWLITALPILQGLTEAGIAMIAAMMLFVIPVNVRQREFTMNWSTASKLPWGVLILFGGGLSLAKAIEMNGVAEFLGAYAASFDWMSALALVIIVTTAVVFFSELASNTATATTMIPILAAMAPGLGMHPYLLIVPAGIAASCAFMMPVGTPPNAIVFATGHVSMPQMIKAGFWLNLIGIVLITALTYFIAIPLLT